jgi:2-polyprenyl-3-methyl-5-hydroxy-6-metoxy-1,4-benzoquinol methylase
MPTASPSSSSSASVSSSVSPDSRRPWRRIGTRWRPGPAERYVHPKAAGLVNAEAEHTANIDVAEDNAPNYLEWIADRCKPHLGQRVLEVGAGTGSITARYAKGRDVVALERSQWCIDEMRKKFAGDPNITVRHADLLELVDEGIRFDSVVLLNVLEHIEDDVAALEMLRGLLVPGGRIVLYVPALNGLYGAWDRKAGHYRRYAPWRMRQVFAAAGLVEVEMRYMNFLSLPPWWLFSHSDVEKSSAGKLSLWDRTGIAIGRRLESVVRVPVGLNLFCVARAKDPAPTV